jgi:hypothetical protein
VAPLCFVGAVRKLSLLKALVPHQAVLHCFYFQVLLPASFFVGYKGGKMLLFQVSGFTAEHCESQ